MKKVALVLLIGLANSNNSFSQTGKNIESSIKKVVVYQQGALVTREAKCQLPKGNTTLILNGLSSKIDPKNLQVKTDSDKAMVVSVSHSIDYMNKNKITEDVKKLEAKRREVTDSINILKNLRSVYSQEKEMILTNKSIGGDNGVNINDLQNAASFFRTRLTEIETNSFKIDKKSIALKEKLVDISKQLMEINSKTDLPSSQIKLVISAERAVETKIEVDYLIGDATWTPTYDIRIKDIDNPLVLTYKAKVNQNSGEDWNDVNLTLSTGNPSVSNTKPTLDTYFLTFNNYYSDIKPLYRPSNQRFTGLI